MPKLPFVDYQVESTLSGEIALNNDQASPLTIYQFDSSSLKAVVVEYSIIRGSKTEVGRIFITTDGIDLSFANDKANNVDTGIKLLGALNMGQVLVQYTSTNTGQSAMFRYSQRALTTA